MPMVEYINTNVYYLNSAYNQLYCGKLQAGNGSLWQQQTGWAYIPNIRYDNWLTMKQWFDLVTNHNKFIIHSCECVVQNMIPLTDNLSIAQDTTFMSFNNSIYALGYTDNHYETFPKEYSTKWELLWREGISYKQNGTEVQPDEKMTLPNYVHYLPTVLAGQPQRSVPFTIYAWDPFCTPSSIQELRPGKNAIKFSWERSGSDDSNWVNTNTFFGMVNQSDSSNVPQMWDYYQNFSGEIITPMRNSKNDPRNPNYRKKESLHYEQYYNSPITQWFLKLMPITGTNNTELKQSAMVVMVKKIRFEVTPRQGTTNFPQVMRSITSNWSGEYKAGLMNASWTGNLGPITNTGVPPYSGIDQHPYANATLELTKPQADSISRLNKGDKLAFPITHVVAEAPPVKVPKIQ